MEKEGRRAAAAARDAISATLTDGQITEAAGRAGAAVHIAVRDAALAVGMSLDEAETKASHWVKALHAAEKEGGAAVAAVEAEIRKFIDAGRDAIDTTEDLADTSETAFEGIAFDAKAIGDQFKDLDANEARELGAAFIRLGSDGSQGMTDIHNAAIATGNALGNDLLPSILAVNTALERAREKADDFRSSLDSIPRDVTTTITTIQRTIEERVSAPAPVPGRQHGGPVGAGRPYMVGERGPELFVPSRSGRIEPHGSSGGGVDAKALAKAVADALQGTRVDVDGRQLGRLVVRHQPLAAAELGGRR